MLSWKKKAYEDQLTFEWFKTKEDSTKKNYSDFLKIVQVIYLEDYIF